MWCSVTLTLLLTLTLTPGAWATRILLLPRPTEPHVEAFIALGEALVGGGGYEVYMMVPSAYTLNPARMKAAHLRVIQYPVAEPDWRAAAGNPGCEDGGDGGEPLSAEDCFTHVTQMTSLGELKARGPAFGELCARLLDNAELYRSLATLGVSHAVVDAHPLVRCYYVLLYKLGVPYASYMQQYDPWLMRAPALPSFAPSVHMERATEAMGLWERVLNTWTRVYWAAFCPLPTLSDSLVATYAPDRPAMTLNQLARQSTLWLADATFLLDYPRPVWPNEALVGGLTARPAAPLPKPLETFVSPANGTAEAPGVIVVHLGGVDGPALPPKTLKLFLDAFATLGTTHRVLWQHKGDTAPYTPPPNVKIVPWLPLNDVLGDGRTRLFITAASHHDQQMALYHGVPMLSVPLTGPLRHNAQKARYNRFGLVVDVLTASKADVIGYVKKMLSSTEYSDNARQASEIWRGEQERGGGVHAPRQMVVDMVTLAVDDKLGHLRPHAMDLPWYQYLMTDLALLAGGIVAMVMWLSCNTASLSLQRLRVAVRAAQQSTPTTAQTITVTNGTMATSQTFVPAQSFKPKLH